MATPFEFNPDITRASTIPSGWYTRPDMLRREQAAVFGSTWQYAGAVQDVALPGSFAAVDIAGVPVVLTRDPGGVLRGFHNVCRHRAGTVAKGCGRRQTLQCGYHGWTYNLDGALRGAPDFGDACDFNKADFGLVPVRVGQWGPFVFANIDGRAPDLAEMLGDIPHDTRELGLDAMRRVERRDYYLDANWKLYVDNYLEGYHIPTAHPGLFRELDYGAYRVETHRYYSSQHAPIRPVVQGADVQHRQYTLGGGDNRALYYWIFPNLTLNIYQGMMQVNVIVPLAHDRTQVVFEWYFPEGGTDGARQAMYDSMQFSHQVQAEDTELCQDVWRNMLGGSYDRGRYSPRHENGVHHFHGLLAAALERGEAGEG